MTEFCVEWVTEIDAALQEEQDARIAIAQLQEIQEAERLLAEAEADQPRLVSRLGSGAWCPGRPFSHVWVVGASSKVNRQKRSEAAWDSGTDAERSLGITLRRDGRPGRLWEGQRRPLQDPRLGKGRTVLAVVS